jgi:site-specific recombinase XerC
MARIVSNRAYNLQQCIAALPLEASYDIRTVQELPGHNDLSTPMIYAHVLNKPGITACSPLEKLEGKL